MDKYHKRDSPQHTMVIQFIEQKIFHQNLALSFIAGFATHNLNDFFEIFVAESFASSSLSERHISSAENQTTP